MNISDMAKSDSQAIITTDFTDEIIIHNNSFTKKVSCIIWDSDVSDSKAIGDANLSRQHIEIVYSLLDYSLPITDIIRFYTTDNKVYKLHSVTRDETLGLSTVQAILDTRETVKDYDGGKPIGTD